MNIEKKRTLKTRLCAHLNITSWEARDIINRAQRGDRRATELIRSMKEKERQ